MRWKLRIKQERLLYDCVSFHGQHCVIDVNKDLGLKAKAKDLVPEATDPHQA